MNAILLVLVAVATVGVWADCPCDFKGCGPQADCPTGQGCACNGIGICDPVSCAAVECIRSVDCCYGCDCTNSLCGGTPGFHKELPWNPPGFPVGDDLPLLVGDVDEELGYTPVTPKLPAMFETRVLSENKQGYRMLFDYNRMFSIREQIPDGGAKLFCDHVRGDCEKVVDDVCYPQLNSAMIPQEPLTLATFKGPARLRGQLVEHWTGFWQIPVPTAVHLYGRRVKGDFAPVLIVFEHTMQMMVWDEITLLDSFPAWPCS